MPLWPWLLTLAIAVVPAWPTLAPQSLSLRFRFADGTPAAGVTAQVIQIVQPAGSTAWRDHGQVVVGQCQAGLDGRCTLVCRLQQPLLYDPELAVTGYQFIGLGGEIGGEDAATAPAQAFQSYPVPPEAWGQTLAFVLLASGVVVGDLNPGGVPSYVQPPPVESAPLTAVAPKPAVPWPSPEMAVALSPLTPAPPATATPCPTCRPARPPAGWDMRTWSLFLVGGGLLLIGGAVYFLWRRDRPNPDR